MQRAILLSLTSSVILLTSLAHAEAPATSADATGFDHSPFHALLKANVKGDLVQYQGFKAAPSFATYVGALGEANVSEIKGKNARLAFYINAYNALTIHQVLSNPGLKSVMKVNGFFKKRIHKLAGKMVSLDDIENQIIRPTFKEPRIHAALNCASISCPPLAPFAFTGAAVNRQLDQVFGAFAKDNVRNQVDPATGSVKLSKILDWYGVDFKSAGGAAAYLARFLQDGPRKQALLKATNVGYLPYDWNLNAK